MDWLWLVGIIAAIVVVGAVVAWLFRPELDNEEQPVRNGRRRLRRLRRARGRRNPDDAIDR